MLQSSPSRLLTLLIGLFFIALVGCATTPKEEDNSDGGNGDNSETEYSLSSTCGTIVKAEVKNPVEGTLNEDGIDEERGVQLVTVKRAVSADTVIVSTSEGDILVRLHAVTDDGVLEFFVQQGIDLIESLTSGGAYLVRTTNSEGITCEAVSDGGGVGIWAQLFTLSGKSVHEELIEIGAVVPEQNGCGADALVGCLASIEVDEVQSSQSVSWFLWKPESERDGKLAVLIDPYGVTVVVRGAITQTLTDFGPSNGRGTTARSNHSGCAFGSATVEFYDSDGLRVHLADGSPTVSIPNGCDRVEFHL